MPPKLLESEAPVVVKHGNVRLDADCQPELMLCCLEFALLEQSNAEQIDRIGMLRLCFQNRSVCFLCFCDLPALIKVLGDREIGRCRASPIGIQFLQQPRRIGMMRVDIQNLAAGLRGVVGARMSGVWRRRLFWLWCLPQS